MFSLKTHHIALQNTFPVKKCLKCYEKEVTEYKQKCTFSVTFAHCPFITVSLVLFWKTVLPKTFYKLLTRTKLKKTVF